MLKLVHGFDKDEEKKKSTEAGFCRTDCGGIFLLLCSGSSRDFSLTGSHSFPLIRGFTDAPVHFNDGAFLFRISLTLAFCFLCRNIAAIGILGIFCACLGGFVFKNFVFCKSDVEQKEHKVEALYSTPVYKW